MADIKFECPKCQQTLEAPADMAGMDLDCPACEASIKIPASKKPKLKTAPSKKRTAAPPTQTGGAAPGKSTKCPKCGSAIAMGAVLCIECGFHFKKKKQLQTKEGAAKARGGGQNNAVVFVLIGVIVIALGAIVWRIISG